ncbi:uncharacterized protein lrrc41 [Eucyclogobius newberryi]|uniref:uncharacterized protein lrrc41 n=1 Tax=Eucyclogobius newberryi TaxID=166745 RepID=UPI003B599A51
MSEDREPLLGLKLLCFRAVRDNFSAVSEHAAKVLPLVLLEELQLHLTVYQLDHLQPALNCRGVSTLSAWRRILRLLRGPSSVVDVSREDEAKLLVMKSLFFSVLYSNSRIGFIKKNLSSLNTSSFLGAAARSIPDFLLVNLDAPLRRLTEELREVLEVLERHVSSVGVSSSLDPSKGENHVALLVLHRLLDHGQVRKVQLQGRCPLTLAWILHRRGPGTLVTSEEKNQTSPLCWGPWSSSEEDLGPACKRPRLDHRGQDHRGQDHRGQDHRGQDHRGQDHRGQDHREEDHREEDHREEDHREEDHREDHREGRGPGSRDGGGVGECSGGRVSPEVCRRGYIDSLELTQCLADSLRVVVCALPSWSCLRSLTLHSYVPLTQSAALEVRGALQKQSRDPAGGVTELSVGILPCPLLLEHLLEACPRLLSLSAEVHCTAGPSGAWGPPPHHCQRPLLQKLSVSLNRQPTPPGVLPSLLQRCPHLRSLQVCGLRLQSGAQYGRLLTTLTGACGGLSSLSLEDMNLSDCLEQILQLLSRCQLQELSMKDCRLLENWSNKEESLQRLTTALAAHRTLHTLSLAHNRIARQVPVLAQLFSGASHGALQRLDLSSNFIQPGELLEFSERVRALRPGRRIVLDLRTNPGDRDPHTWSAAVSNLVSCCRLLLKSWTSTDPMVDHISNM